MRMIGGGEQLTMIWASSLPHSVSAIAAQDGICWANKQ